uniref:Biogenesis of lysosome-related organelles complex 1 subunit 4 n=2 Tax=Drosophila melanogaster TaxID=7227 RepID=BL1S4_DROME|nr:biogenesis of lysosome-related organelles complex 1, subunit 4, isoform B [Drosophila melanogaster]NP_648414.1 biogenesis of lysosome-related organelles complex 1, subunit 4, isoform A [Drosophila melanogaster]Q9VTC2.1 RecName: Full=Biogenesis of lysosome-related organelles complex 1 subunit 4; Short=BLOC-1 subunit 4; AltName: Full=Protein cappuccino homolog [Drosophila melanogaster]AAF50130.1 biogenesis of lysosome-related organelles complex 1, subunit 4, isoform A [Drosophila melanogaster]|eukprot:NP_001261689.1 biogenesis of lysosome-related organelles complex 1, subunit 4, isoform B [Drosophila melanogaster]
MQSNIENVSRDYAKILQSADLEKEINPLCTNIEDMLARLDEFETLLASVRAESNGMMANNVCSILGFTDSFEQLKARIDGLEQCVGVVSANLSEVERSVDIAEEELHVTDYSLKGLLLKPLKAKLSASDTSTLSSLPRSNLVEEEYQPVEIYKSDDYFGKSEEENYVAK